ncbi:MAG: hypothetical protein KF833_21035 [Verrucomicrobiae bacterium]|nr:hypothetical protein [Verrucomicrobiae bacterium]
MATNLVHTANEATLLARAFDVESGDLPNDVARVFLRARLPDADLARMSELGERAQRGQLTAGERREAEAYDRVGLLIELLHSKARQSLRGGKP